MSLDNFDPSFTCNYHLYQVRRTFEVESGPIAPGFGQPGLGRQYQPVSSLVPGSPMPLNVNWLLSHHYLAALPIPADHLTRRRRERRPLLVGATLRHDAAS